VRWSSFRTARPEALDPRLQTPRRKGPQDNNSVLRASSLKPQASSLTPIVLGRDLLEVRIVEPARE
jgi:hypothetical protein